MPSSDEETLSPESPGEGSSTTTKKDRPFTHNDYTVGWICALPKEQTAATAMLDDIHPTLPKLATDQNTYTLGSIAGHNIVIACLPNGVYGNVSAATAAKSMVDTFQSIRFGLMVGIGGGVPSAGVRLGDVVVSKPGLEFPGVVQWDIGKTENKGQFRRTGALNKPPTLLLTASSKLVSNQELYGSKMREYLSDMGERYPRLVPKYTSCEHLEDSLCTPRETKPSDSGWSLASAIYAVLVMAFKYILGYGMMSKDSLDQNSLNPSYNSNLERGKSAEIAVHYGLIASGDQVMKDANSRDRLNESLGGQVLCIEMEAAGLMDEFPCMVIRGICDYADSKKSKEWQEYAAAVAAAYAKELLQHVQISDVDEARPVKEILSDVRERLESVHVDVGTIKHRQSQTWNSEVLNWLTEFDYGPQHSDIWRKRQPGTCQWFLDSDEYEEWLASEARDKERVLFCPGDPGVGKTVLTATVIEDLAQRFLDDTQVGIAYVYCSFKRTKEQELEHLLAALIKQLSQSQVSLPSSVMELFERHKSRKTRPSAADLSQVLKSVVAMYSRVFIIADAFDECSVSDGCRDKFVSEVLALQRLSSTQISFLATSRPLPQIERHFSGCISKSVRATDEDIRRYIDSQMHRMREFVQRDESLKEEIKTKIVAAVEGVFLLARFHSDFISESTTIRAIREGLDKIPQGPDGYDYAYNEAMMRIKTQVRDPQQMAVKALSWITFSERNLSVEELQHALATRAGDTDFDEESIPDANDIISVCAGLVAVDEESNIARLVHHTLQEYFMRTEADWFPESDMRITEICISYLSFHAYQHERLTNEHSLEQRLHKFKLYQYCSIHWGDHARATSCLCPEVMPFLRSGGANLTETSRVISMHDKMTLPENQVTALHIAAYFGMTQVAEELLKDGFQVDGLDDSELVLNAVSESESLVHRTPLQLAARHGHLEMTRLLLDHGADVESMQDEASFDESPLSWAAPRGHESIARLLLDRGANVDSKARGSGETPFLLTARTGNETMVKLLLDRGANIEAREGSSAVTALYSASRLGDQAMVNLLIDRGAEIDTREESSGMTPLISAIIVRNEAIVRLLLSRGANIELKELLGASSLWWASWEGDQTVVQLLLSQGADIESKDEDGKSPLSIASLRGHHAVAKLLLENGADIESRDWRGVSPLQFAASNCDTNSEAANIVRLLLECGADVECKDHVEGKTPLSEAAFLGDVSIVEQLLDHGAGIESLGCGHTPLATASWGGRLEVVRLLLTRGANVEAICSRKSQTSLLLATEAGYDEIVKLLLEWDADTEAKDSSNQTPLILASRYGFKKVAQHLLDHGADIAPQDNNGWTALRWASYCEKNDIVKLLLERVADAGESIVLVRKHLDQEKSGVSEPAMAEEEKRKKEGLNDDDKTCLDQPASPVQAQQFLD